MQMLNRLMSSTIMLEKTIETLYQREFSDFHYIFEKKNSIGSILEFNIYLGYQSIGHGFSKYFKIFAINVYRLQSVPLIA